MIVEEVGEETNEEGDDHRHELAILRGCVDDLEQKVSSMGELLSSVLYHTSILNLSLLQEIGTRANGEE